MSITLTCPGQTDSIFGETLSAFNCLKELLLYILEHVYTKQRQQPGIDLEYSLIILVRSQPTSIPTKHKGINTSASFTKAWNVEKYLGHKIHQDFTAINKFLQRNSLREGLSAVMKLKEKGISTFIKLKQKGISAFMKLKEKGISAFIKLKRKVLRLNTCLTSNMYVNASQPRILSVNIYVRGGLFSLLHI